MTDAPDESTDRDPGVVVSVRPHGPYVVTGLASISRWSEVRSEHGEPMTWRRGAAVGTSPSAALCRCGRSGNKPFCDGQHAKVGFDGTETAPDEPRSARAKGYAGPGIVVHDDRSICTHAGFCGNRTTNVWKLVGAGATDDSITRMQVIAMVERCPSGALTYSLDDDPAEIEPPLPEGIGVIDDGPLYLTGGVRVERVDGTAMETRNRVTLCRCGESKTKPLCDGSHKDAGFEDH